jgi:hypothetical protein
MAPLFHSCPLWIGSLFLAYTPISKYFGDGIGEKQEEARIKTAQKLNKQVCPVLNTKITNPSHVSRPNTHDFPWPLSPLVDVVSHESYEDHQNGNSQKGYIPTLE